MILALYGAGALGREFRAIAEESGAWSEIVFIDDHADQELLSGCRIFRFQIFRTQFSPEEVRFAVAIGEPKFRLESYDRMTRAGYQGALLIHSSAYVSPDAEVGEGTVICDHVMVGSKARVGRNCYLSRNCSIGHDAIIADHTRLGVGAFVGGHTEICENAFIGAGALLRDRIHVGSGSIVALGAAVFEDVPDSVTVIGNPARISGEGVQSAVYAPSKAIERARKESGTLDSDVRSGQSVPERFWEVFGSCFEGIDFNPVSFRYHDDGWDSLTHMKLISRLEDEFHVTIKGREIMRLKSYSDGLKMIQRKLKEMEGAGQA